MKSLPSALFDLADIFNSAGFELALVGGTVRDVLLGRPSNDYDFATSATPAETSKLLRKWTSTIWEIGKEFGTIGGQFRTDDDEVLKVEITTYRSDEYQPNSRKPGVVFGDNLDDDLARRDFTVNAMAVRLPSLTFVDPYGGLNDLAKGILRTPIEPEISFGDDPLRMLRAARFAAQFDFTIELNTLAAMCEMAARIEIISAERISAEFAKMMLAPHPQIGLEVLVESQLIDYFLPEIPALRLEIDEHHRHKDVYEHSLKVLSQAMDLETDDDGPVPGPDLTLRLAALFHDIGKPATRRFEPGGGVSFHGHDLIGARITRKRLRSLRFEKSVVTEVAKLVELHLRFHGYGEGIWTDSAVRRFVTDAGPLLDRLIRLTRADCTTRNLRKANMLWAACDDLESRIAALREQEALDAIRPDLDGNQIMEILGVPPGRIVGEAYQYLLALRMEQGPLEPERATQALQDWYDRKLGGGPRD
ncbi:MAG: CCA tRNA nucleotidyltransferase [Promicromonosporaceae bacterium]|nr:CCA tRNA nucleotidyltransferase [Promicromonosporaceae bacterium]